MNVVSDGMGSWSYDFLQPLLARTFPHTMITYDNMKEPDLVVKSHFANLEKAKPYSCPVIFWSGESRPVPLGTEVPLFELNTFHSSRPNSVWFPHLVAELRHTERPATLKPKRFCAAYAFSNPIPIRELVFRTMRTYERTCYAFGRSCHTSDNPFPAPAAARKFNATAFDEFAFIVAMENAVVPGYLTEKIGYAFAAGAVPIYWGDTATATDFFNPASFLNVADYMTPEAAATTAVHIWRDPQKLQRFLDAPIRINDRLADYEAIYTEYRPWQAPMVTALKEAFPDFS